MDERDERDADGFEPGDRIGDAAIEVKPRLFSRVRYSECATMVIRPRSQWTRVNLNSNRTDPCASLCHLRQVPARLYPMLARFYL